MPVHLKVVKRKGKTKYAVVDDKDKVEKVHSTRKAAVSHIRGKNLGILRSKGRRK